ncbi:hypothetical protein DPMN_063512, partial [Dreissena polymorpha]
ALCRDCNAHQKARAIGKYVCHKCHAIIEEGHIKYKGEAFHPYHFNCNSCSQASDFLRKETTIESHPTMFGGSQPDPVTAYGSYTTQPTQFANAGHLARSGMMCRNFLKQSHYFLVTPRLKPVNNPAESWSTPD